MAAQHRIVCEIHAADDNPLSALQQIVKTCARDIGQPIVVDSSHSSAAFPEPVITLHLPAELAASEHPVWCLACRLACFCPQARVSVLVSAASAFKKKASRYHHSSAA